jgi:hypothetical protein
MSGQKISSADMYHSLTARLCISLAAEVAVHRIRPADLCRDKCALIHTSAAAWDHHSPRTTLGRTFPDYLLHALHAPTHNSEQPLPHNYFPISKRNANPRRLQLSSFYRRSMGVLRLQALVTMPLHRLMQHVRPPEQSRGHILKSISRGNASHGRRDLVVRVFRCRSCGLA